MNTTLRFRADSVVPRVAVVALIVAGLVLRAWCLHGRLGTLDSDEAGVGLIARHLLHGEFRAFFWGQHYGGTPGAFLDALAFAIAGSSVLALKSVQIVLAAVAALLVWRVGRRTVGEAAARVAALLFWIAPASYVWWSTKDRLFYWPGVVLGLLVVLTALRLAENPDRWRDALVMGLAAGLGWWATPQILYYVVPAGLWLLAFHRRALRWLPVVVAGAVVGAAPWLTSNLRNGFWSFDLPAQPVHMGYAGHLRVLIERSLPLAFGLRVAYVERWLFPGAVVVYILVLLATLLGCVRPSRPVLLVGGAALLFPFIYALSPFTWFAGEGRYVLFAAPFLVLLLARAFSARLWMALAVLGVALAGTVAGLAAMRPYVEPYAPDLQPPVSLAPLVHSLESHHETRVFTDYWLAYRLSFETRERVIATPATASRYEPYDRKVRTSPRQAWVFVAGSKALDTFRAVLDERHVATAESHPGGFVVVVPDRTVLPEELPAPALP